MKIVLISIIAFLFVSCSNNKKDFFEIEEPLIESGFEKFRINVLDSLYITIRKIEKKDDAIYILDNINHRVCLLDSNYKLIKTIGRKGQGPGEFRWSPQDIKVAYNKLFVLSDYKLDIFSESGDFIKSTIVASSWSNLEINENDSTILVLAPLHTNNKQQDIHLYTVLDKDGNILQEIKIESKYLSKAKSSFSSRTIAKIISDKIIVNEVKDDIFHIFDLKNNYIKTVKGYNQDLKNKRINKPAAEYHYTDNELIELKNGFLGAINSVNNDIYLDIYDNELNYKGKIVFLEKENQNIRPIILKIIEAVK